jgi:hypothetical protein
MVIYQLLNNKLRQYKFRIKLSKKIKKLQKIFEKRTTKLLKPYVL